MSASRAGRRLIECVPNFSEGRDLKTVDAIVDAIAGTPGVQVLARESDTDHNRSVITFAGEPEPVAEGTLRGVREAVERIDLRGHSGVHPRLGAADVVPFVPIEGVTIEESVAVAVRTAGEVWRTLKVPVYLYEAAARSGERVNLENIRRGGLEFLRAGGIMTRPPDIGDAVLHPTAGATVIGARKFLIAFNVNLTTGDVSVAKAIARKIRASGGGLPCLKALGLTIASRGLAQVSMNLTDFELTGLRTVFDAVRAEAARFGAGVRSSEIIGLVPRRAVEGLTAADLRLEGALEERVLESRLG